MKHSITLNNFLKKHKSTLLWVLAIAFWIAVWEAVALRIGSELIIATPVKVAKVFFEGRYLALARVFACKDILRICACLYIGKRFGGGILENSGGEDTFIPHHLGDKVDPGGVLCNTRYYLVRKQKPQHFHILPYGLPGDIPEYPKGNRKRRPRAFGDG